RADASGTTDSASRTDGTTTYRLDLRDDDDTGYPFDLTVDDTGVLLDFPAGTFVGPDPAALTEHTVRGALPLAIVVSLGLLALLIGLISLGTALRRGSRRAPPGALRDLVWWLGTATAISTVWLFVWASSDMPSDWPEFPPLGLAALAALLGGALSLALTLRQRPTK
ncbi:MAG: hypothetical protein Q7T71_14490, partial [Herbiconiux sp.]|nr:hypothetical protein [Herbiconiux sp.]